MSDSKAMTSTSTAITLVRGWSVMLDGEEPRIQDEELGRRLGFKRTRKIRDLIKRLIKEKKLNDIRIRPAAGRIEIRRGVFREQAVNEFWLTKKQALKVIAKAGTRIADQILDEVIDVYDAVTSGRFVPRWIAVPVPQNSLTLGDLHRPEIRKACKDTAERIGTSTHQVQGWLTILYAASGVYRISAAHREPVLKLLDRWSKGEAPTPTPARRLLKPAAPRSTQCKLPFPETIQ